MVIYKQKKISYNNHRAKSLKKLTFAAGLNPAKQNVSIEEGGKWNR